MMQREGLERIMNHLLFHKAIIYEEERTNKFDQYMEILERAKLDSFSSRDQADRTFEVVFDLVLRNDMDPWDIDLMEFSRLYTERMERREVDFIVAGKLLFMAWSILRRQSERILTVQEGADLEELFCMDWDMDSMGLFLEEEEPYRMEDFDPGEVELCEVIRHRERRPVMLVELLDAFEEASKEAKDRLEHADHHEKEEPFEEKAHTEELERDLEEVWERISRCGGGPIAIEDLCDGTKSSLIKVLVSVLFLTRIGKISLWQDDLPRGQIFLEVKIPWDIGTLEDVAEAPIEMINGQAVM